jgi:hypothetical protein
MAAAAASARPGSASTVTGRVPLRMPPRSQAAPTPTPVPTSANTPARTVPARVRRSRPNSGVQERSKPTAYARAARGGGSSPSHPASVHRPMGRRGAPR